MAEIPQGIVALFIAANGRVIASANDFARDRPGGYSIKSAQEYRVKRALALAVVDAYCSPDFARAFDAYEAENVMRRLTSEHKCRVEFVMVGHKDE